MILEGLGLIFVKNFGIIYLSRRGGKQMGFDSPRGGAGMESKRGLLPKGQAQGWKAKGG